MNQRNGMSLIEVIIVIGMSAAILLVLTQFLSVIIRTKNVLNAKLAPQEDFQQLSGTIEYEIKSIGPSAAGAYPVDTAGTTTLIFYSDPNADGIMERVRYTIGTSTLQRGVIKPVGNPAVYATTTEVVTTPLTNIVGASSTFNYYDENYTGVEAPLAQPVAVTAVRVIEFKITENASSTAKPVFDQLFMARGLKTN